MKKLLTLLIAILISGAAFADDTAALQAQLNAGDAMLSPGHTYNITGVTLTHNLIIPSGAEIHLTSNNGAAIRVMGANLTISGAGTISGVYDITKPGSFAGASGVTVYKDNFTITGIHLTNFSASCIAGSAAVNNPNINHCILERWGTIGIFFDSGSGTSNTIGGNISYNTIDNSAVAAGIVLGEAIAVRGHTDATKPTPFTTNWTISHNALIMPSMPSQINSECMEVRFMLNSNVSYNSCTGGSIGISAVGTNGVTIEHNQILNSSLENIEWAGGTNGIDRYNKINGSVKDGILLDGVPGTTGLIILADTISNSLQESIHLYVGNTNTTITNCVISAKHDGIDIQQSSGVHISGTNITAVTGANVGISFDNSIGSTDITGGSIIGFPFAAVNIYGSKPGLITDNIIGKNITLTSSPKKLNSILSGGASIGTNIHINDQAIDTGLFCGSYTHYTTSITLTGIHDTTITNKWFSVDQDTACLRLISCSNVKIVNCLFGQKQVYGVKNVGLYIFNSNNITARNSYYENVASGVLVLNSETVKVDSNQFRNMQGLYPRGSFVQFASVTGPNCSISYNKGENFDGKSSTRNMIDVITSYGTAGNPIQVNFNQLRANNPTNTDGGGIMLGDNQGDYQIASYNIIVSPGSYGVAIAGGKNNTLLSNKIFSPPHAGSASSSYGVMVYNLTPVSGNCFNLNVRGNFINWFSDKYHRYNPIFNPGSCTSISGLALNILNANINASILPAQLLTTCLPFN